MKRILLAFMLLSLPAYAMEPYDTQRLTGFTYKIDNVINERDWNKFPVYNSVYPDIKIPYEHQDFQICGYPGKSCESVYKNKK